MSNVMLRRAGVPVLAAIAASSLAGGAAAEPETIRIACGAAAAFTDAAGRAWREDAGFFDGVAVTDVGAPADIATECRSERYGMSGFWVPAANGRHRVTLTFCEAYDGIEGAGGRVFDVQVEGVPLRGIDPFAQGGGRFMPSTRSVVVNVRDGKLDIVFIRNKQSPQINAIVIEPLPFGGETAAPEGFDRARDVPRGEIRPIRYPSKTAGGERPANVYTPPGFSPQRRYPVLYLLHGSGDDETSWTTRGAMREILDNLFAEGQAEPMIVVMPLGVVRWAGAGSDDESREARQKAFERDLMDDLIPYVETNYPEEAETSRRALAGLSMGAGQTCWIGSRHLGRFAYLGMFSGGMVGRTFDDVAAAYPEGVAFNASKKLFWISCGHADVHYAGVLRTLDLFDARGVEYHWLLQDGSHDWPVWREALYLFSQRLFRKSR